MKNFIYFLLILLVQSIWSVETIAFPPSPETDSLYIELSKNIDDTNRVDALNEIAWKIRRSYPDSALIFANEALNISKKIRYETGLAISHKTIGSIYKDKGKYEESKNYYQLGFEYYVKLSQNKNQFYFEIGKIGSGGSLVGIGLVEWRLGNFTEAFDNFYNAIEIYEELDYTLGLANCHNNIGLIHWNQNNYDRAIEYFITAKNLYTKINHRNGRAYALNNIGTIYKKNNKNDTALMFYNEALNTYLELDDKKGISSIYNNIAQIHRNTGAYELSKEYFYKALELHKSRDDNNGIALIYGNLALLHILIADEEPNAEIKIANYKQALQYAKNELKIAEQIGSLIRKIDAYNSMSDAYEGLNQFENALNYHQKYVNLKDSLFNKEKNKQFEEAEVRFQAEKKQQEIENQKLIIKRQKTIRNSFVVLSILVVMVAILLWNQFILKKRTNKILREKNEELNKLSIVASETDNAVIITDPDGNFEWINAGFTKLYDYSFEELLELRGNNLFYAAENKELEKLFSDWEKDKKPIQYKIQTAKKSGEKIWVHTTLNPVLNNENEIIKIVVIESDITELKNAEQEILQWKEGITDSISYAKRIQEAMLPSGIGLKNNFKDSFIINNPKAIVSGDFYWYHKIEHKIIVVAADCTGHGVPGAFMSLIGISFLNKIIKEKGIIHPDEILNQLHESIISSLHKPDNQGYSNDSMDLSIVLIDTNERIIEYTGAMNPIYIISNNELKEYKPNIVAIGEPYLPKNFTKQTINYHENDILYMFSDGFADQYGGKCNSKLKYQKFKKKLIEIHQKPLSKQENELWKYFQEWKGNNEQIDDILVLGLKL